jgi:hypothetical protein
MQARDELAALQAENARPIALLESHDIQWRPPQPVVPALREPEPSKLSTADKVALFRRLFRGRTNVYPVRWEGKTSGKSGYGCMALKWVLLGVVLVTCYVQIPSKSPPRS